MQAQVHRLYEIGMQLVRRGLFDDAIQTFREGLRWDSHNVVLLNAIGATYSLENKPEEADRYFLDVLHLDPKFVPARRNLAISYFKSGSFDLASREFHDLLQTRENRAVASLFLGMIAAKRKEYPQAIKFFDESGNLLFQYPDSVLLFAHSLYKIQQKVKSQTVLSQLGSLPTVSADNWLQAGTLYLRLGEYQEALGAFQKGLQKKPQAPKLSYKEAFTLYKMGRYSDALEILQKLTTRDPDGDSLNLLGHVAEDMGMISLALHAFTRAVELAPNVEENYLDFSTLCMNYGNNALALDVVKAGLAHVPHSYRLVVQEGAILGNLGKQREAEEMFRLAMKLRSDNREAFLGLAIAQIHADQFDEAIETLSDGVKRFPRDFSLHYYYAFALFRFAERQGMKGEIARKAKKAIAQTLQVNPQSAGSYYLLAKFNAMEKNPQRAVENLRTCLRLDPKFVPAKYELALWYLKTGKRQDGQSLLREVKQQQAEEFKKEQTRPRIILAQQQLY